MKRRLRRNMHIMFVLGMLAMTSACSGDIKCWYPQTPFAGPTTYTLRGRTSWGREDVPGPRFERLQEMEEFISRTGVTICGVPSREKGTER